MSLNLEELANHYSRINIRIVDIVKYIAQPGQKLKGARTPPVSGMIFPIRGKARMIFDGMPYEMEPGKVFNSGPGMSLEKEVIGNTIWEFMVIHYEAEDRAENSIRYWQSHYELNPGCNPRINDMLMRLYNTCEISDGIHMFRAKSIFLCILDEIFTCSGNRINDCGSELVNNAIEYINLHLNEQITIPELARRYDLDAKQFSYLFQKYTAVSPKEYLIKRRMKYAKKLLLTTSGTVSEVSACVGYSDPFYFSRLFKKYNGVSPSVIQTNFEKNTN